MALGHLTLYIFPMDKKGYDTKTNTKRYPNIYKYIQYVQDINKIPSGCQAAAARPGPEPRLVFCIYPVYLVYIWIYFGIFLGRKQKVTTPKKNYKI